MLNVALRYREEDYWPIPIRPDESKKPHIKWTKYQKVAPSKDEIAEWWSKWPNADIGLITGKHSGLTVVDIDSDDAKAVIDEQIPDSYQLPVARTQKGWHYYFKYADKMPNKSNVIDKVDIRNDGGYIIAPPSSGKRWVSKISEVGLNVFPSSLYNILYTSNCKDRANLNNKHNNNNIHNISFESGGRDESIFHVANMLVKGGMSRGNIVKCLEIIGAGCTPPFPEDEIQLKIDSAFNRLENSKINLTAELREWLNITWGNISITDALHFITNITYADRPKITTIMNRFVKEGLIERVSGKNGVYRKVESEIEELDWQNADTSTVDIKLPFGLDRIAKIQPGNIISVMGEPNAGKTAIMMNMAHDNMNDMNVHYFTSEMGKEEFKSRAELFPNTVISQWKVKLYERSNNFADVIKTGKGNLNIIDYMEMHDNFWMVAKFMSAIHDKLDGALCVVGLQKNYGQDLGRGGTFAIEKPRLSIAVGSGHVKIVKCKAFVGNESPKDKIRNFKLVGGCQFRTYGDWHHEGTDELNKRSNWNESRKDLE